MADVLYPYDDTGRSAANLVTGELQILSINNADPYRYFIPTFAPFYETNLKLFAKTTTGVEFELKRYTDFALNTPYLGASRANGAAVWGAVSIIRADIQGPIRLEYQCLGGKYSADRDIVIRTIAENNYNPRRIAWDQVTSIQEYFPPSNHPMDLDYFTSYRDMIDAVDRLNTAPGADDILRDLIWRHILDHNDPHETLSLMGNYVLKTDAQTTTTSLQNSININSARITKNSEDIAILMGGGGGGGGGGGIDYQPQIDLLKGRVTKNEQDITALNQSSGTLSARVSDIETNTVPRVASNTQAIASLNPRVTSLEQNLVTVNNTLSNHSTRITTLEELPARVTTIENNIISLRADMINMSTTLSSSMMELETKVNEVSSAISLDDELPTERSSELILVMTPHLRFMAWDKNAGPLKEDEDTGEMVPTGAYTRAPWHQPGILQYSYHNPSNGMTGYLLVEPTTAHNKEDYPDLVQALGLSPDPGTFTLVDMRGEFLRVLDNGRGLDVNRTLRSKQNSSIKSHSHNSGNLTATTTTAIPALTGDSSTDKTIFLTTNTGQSEDRVLTSTTTVSGSTANSGGAETYPPNIAIPLWISI